MYTINSCRKNLIISPSYGDFCTLNTYGGQMSSGNLSYYHFAEISIPAVTYTNVIKAGVRIGIDENPNSCDKHLVFHILIWSKILSSSLNDHVNAIQSPSPSGIHLQTMFSVYVYALFYGPFCPCFTIINHIKLYNHIFLLV